MKSNRPVQVEVILKPGESVDRLIKRFIKKCKKSDIIKEHLEKVSFFKTRSEKRKQKIAKNRYLKQSLEKKHGVR